MVKDNEEKDQIATPGADMDNYVFEQIEGGKFACWNKKRACIEESMPSELSDYVPLDCDELPWKLAEKLEDYKDHETLWEEIKRFIEDHVFLPDDRLYDVCSAWVLSTWVPEIWKVVPYLLVKGPLSSGKTRLLETLEAITYRGIFSANMSCSALFRISELYRPTFFLDETEILNKEEYGEVKHLLNAGYRRGQKAWRVDHTKNGMLIVRGYDVFGFKALAGTQALANTLHSRSIVIDMVKTPRRINFTVNEPRAKAIRNRLLLWRFRKLSESDENDDYDDSAGVYPLLEQLKDGRLMELFYCLLKVSNQGHENILEYAKEVLTIREAEEQTGLEYQALEAIQDCANETEGGKLLVKIIRAKMNVEIAEGEKLTTNFVTKILSGLGFYKTHTSKGVAFMVNTKMLSYRLQQFRVGDTPSGKSSFSSFSSQSSLSSQEETLEPRIQLNQIAPNEPVERCELCGEYSVAYKFTHNGQELRRCKYCIEKMQTEGFKFTTLREVNDA